jgi:hypothetical protein
MLSCHLAHEIRKNEMFTESLLMLVHSESKGHGFRAMLETALW